MTLHISVNGPYFADMDGIVCIARWQHEGIPKDYKGIEDKVRTTVQLVKTIKADLAAKR